jgi:hypothetical protein
MRAFVQYFVEFRAISGDLGAWKNPGLDFVTKSGEIFAWRPLHSGPSMTALAGALCAGALAPSWQPNI